MNENHHHGRIAVLLNSFHRGFALVPEGLDHTANMISWPTREFKRPEDVRRLVACWNALVGVDTGLIEDGRLFAMLAPPAACTADDAELFSAGLSALPWTAFRDDNIGLLQHQLNNFLRAHAPAISLAQKHPQLSRTNSAQDESFQIHGADYKARMLAAVAFGRQLELENGILRDQLRIHEAAAAGRPAPPPVDGDQAPAVSEGTKA
jgi:hypothetical protein